MNTLRVGLVVMGVGRSGNPGDVVGRIVVDPRSGVLRREKTETIIIDEDGRGATLTGVCLHRLLDRFEGWPEDVLKGFLVDGHLDGDMREGSIDFFVGERREGGKVAGVLEILGNGTDGHGDVLEDLEGKKLENE